MRQSPENYIAKEAVKVWRITALIPTLLLWILLILFTFLAGKFSIPVWVVLISWAVVGVETYISIFLVPAIKWRRWRYQVFEQEIDIQHGILIIKRTLVPMIRVQHVDTKQGPILKRFKLATVTISTAATTHEIPALHEEEASDLRDKISQLARVDEDDI
ncbi:PH domain-containing protein [Virgibacillus senegalensis]|uniref:PH domain-containing protein n=1 Tax=Virgibacillus senegalensis TaxID=1499679 RepID=UPI000DA61B7E